jgi:hypothetical protein
MGSNGVLQLGNGDTNTSNDSYVPIVIVRTIAIYTQPANTTVVATQITTESLSVNASETLGATITYQWYQAADVNYTNPVAITGATNSTFPIPIGLTTGTYFYYVVISDPSNVAGPITSNVAIVTVRRAPAVGAIDLNTLVVDGDYGNNDIWTFTNGILTINDGADVEITGTTTAGIQVVVNGTANIMLYDASISGMAAGISPISLSPNANLTLDIEGTNSLIAGNNDPAIEVPDTASLTVVGDGILNATGGVGIGSNTGTAGSFTLGNGGGNDNAVVFASSPVLSSSLVNSITTANLNSGILFDGVTGAVYGNVTPVEDWTIPNGSTLAIPNSPVASLTIPVGTVLTNNGTIVAGGSLTIDGSFINNGTISLGSTGVLDNNGAFSNTTNGTIESTGTINNDGSIVNVGIITNDGTLTNQGSGTIENNGTLTNNDLLINDGTINNNGTLTNSEGAALENDGSVNNNGTINNSGSLNEGGEGTINNTGSIENNGTINTNGSIVNDNGILSNGGNLNNGGSIANQNGGGIINSGTLDNEGTFDNTSNFTNTETGTVSGSGVFTGDGPTFIIGLTDTATSIPLLATDTYTFPATTAGYSAQTPLSVTVSNNGNQVTGYLTITLSGENANSFTVDPISLANIAVANNTSFTVVPVTGLGAGIYTATITVAGGNGITSSFDVSFTVNATNYAISLNPANIDFGSVVVGYSSQTAQTVTITNIGNQATGNLTVAFSGTNADSFTLSTTSISGITAGVSGNTDTFTIVPNDGLGVGTYSTTVTVSGENNIAASLTVSFRVTSVSTSTGSGSGSGSTPPTVPPVDTPVTPPVVPPVDPPVTPPPTPPTELPFVDVGGHWALHNGSIPFVWQNELMQGTSDTNFSPDANLSRAMLLTILYRIAEEPGFPFDVIFDDVQSNQWYSEAVLWAAQNGIAQGIGNNLFAPEVDITREQTVLLLYRYAIYKGYVVSNASLTIPTDFYDFALVSPWAYEAMAWAISSGLIEGHGNEIMPSNTITRAEFATLITRFMNLFIN